MMLSRRVFASLPCVRITLIVAALAGSSLLSGAVAARVPGPGLHTGEDICHDGQTRSYDIRIPSGIDLDDSIVPLVVDLHGFTANSTIQRQTSGFDELAESKGFIVVYPQGLFQNPDGPSWNGGPNCCGAASSGHVDDVGFIRAIIEELLATYTDNIDRSRIFATGASNGGALTEMLACKASDLITAFAPVAFPAVNNSADCSGSCPYYRPRPIIVFQAGNDEVIPFNGGPTVLGTPVMSADDTIAVWRQINRCPATSSFNAVPPSSSLEPAFCKRYENCDTRAMVERCTVRGGDIVVPGVSMTGHDLYNNLDNLPIAETAYAFMMGATAGEYLPAQRCAASADLTASEYEPDLSCQSAAESTVQPPAAPGALTVQ